MDKLIERLRQIDGKGYKAYKDIEGAYRGERMTLHVDHVQGDPFASPSRVRVSVPQRAARLPREWYADRSRQVALEDFLARELAENLRKQAAQGGGTGNSGLIAVDVPGQEVLPRTAVRVSAETVEFRLSVGLPAAGRTIMGRRAETMLTQLIPDAVERTLFSLSAERLREHLELADQQQAIRKFLRENGYVSFVANGAVLPRESGISDRPLRGGRVVPFQAPPSLEIEIPVPHRGSIRGMGIPEGITLIVGGGYHGKSTLLKAIERGVYNHIPGDGREFVITDETAVKIRAEDGRRVEKVDISPFIGDLPFGQNTRAFSTADASGSTSQAANIIEALEVGTRALLIDEDTSATNFMIRDARMQRLVAKGKEPITPFIDKVRQLYAERGVSTILVVGGSGDYFEVADRVIMMDEYRPQDVTGQAKDIAREIGGGRQPEGGAGFGTAAPRVVLPRSFDVLADRRGKVEAKGLHTVLCGDVRIDLSFVEALVDPSQTRAIADMLKLLAKRYADGTTPLTALIDRVYALIEEKGLDAVSPYYGQHPGDLALPRKHELAAALNRLRSLQVKG